MYLFDNAVLQRGLLANLRMSRGFLLLLLFLSLESPFENLVTLQIFHINIKEVTVRIY